jgi:hypothetical protein
MASRAVLQKIVRSTAESDGFVLGIQERAAVDRKAAAAYARGQALAQSLQESDPPVDVLSPGAR